MFIYAYNKTSAHHDAIEGSPKFTQFKLKKSDMGITLTESAARHIKLYLTEHGSKVAFRVAVKSTGCSGYMYVIEAADEIKEQDHVFESNGIKVIVDPESFNLLAGTELDYTRDGINEGFRFHNPNVQTTCGCGESFNV